MATPSQPNSKTSRLEHELKNLEGSRFTHFLSEYGLKILSLLALFFLAILLLYFFAASHESASEGEYIQAENNFVLFKRNLSMAGDSDEKTAFDSLAKLDLLIVQYPSLNAKYDGPLAQLLLSSGHPERALPYAERLFKRIHSPSLDNYSAFANTSLEISRGQSDTAVQEAKTLEEKISPAERDLAIFNTLRLASTSSNPSEWQALKDKLIRENSPAAYQELASLFQDGDVSLLQYIDVKTKPFAVE